MASIISASTTSATALNLTADTSGQLEIKTGSTPTTAITVDASQRAAFVAGTAALPAITTTGDTNTGIFFSAADTIDFAEGGTACGQFDSSSNFKFNSGYGSVATAYGCRAWVSFNGTGTVAIFNSGNVSSITDNGVGDYTINMTTSMPDVNYSIASNAAAVGSTNFQTPIKAVSSVSAFSIYTSNGTTATDSSFICAQVFR